MLQSFCRPVTTGDLHVGCAKCAASEVHAATSSRSYSLCKAPKTLQPGSTKPGAKELGYQLMPTNNQEEVTEQDFQEYKQITQDYAPLEEAR